MELHSLESFDVHGYITNPMTMNTPIIDIDPFLPYYQIYPAANVEIQSIIVEISEGAC